MNVSLVLILSESEHEKKPTKVKKIGLFPKSCKNCFLPTSHLLPVYPASQVQLKLSTRSVQVPLLHGLSEQSSISASLRKYDLH